MSDTCTHQLPNPGCPVCGNSRKKNEFKGVDMTTYSEVRRFMQPGDLIAFGGKGAFSNIIKDITKSPVSHVACVYQRKPLNGVTSYMVEVVESTSLYGKKGVQVNRLSTHMTHYGGEIWWLPLDQHIRNKMNHSKFSTFVEENLGKPYDFKQAIGSAFDWLDKFGLENDEDYTKFFCSEFWAAIMKNSGGIPEYVNPSECTPIEVCRWKLFDKCVQLKGGNKEIPGFNTIVL